MKDSPLEMTLLFDFYGEILTDKQRDFFDLYYNNDYSLAEIAENVGITRQGVRDIISRAEQILRNMESKLGLVARAGRVQDSILEIRDSARFIENFSSGHSGTRVIASHAQRIRELADKIAEEGL